LPYGQGHLEESQNTELSKEETEKQIEERIKTYNDMLTALFDQYNVDVIMVNDNPAAVPLGQTYAPAGWPAMTIPAGYTETGEPISISFVARPYEEGKMLATAFVIEQLAKAYRMPVILHPDDYDEWLHPGADPGLLLHLLRPYPAAEMMSYPVSTFVNSPANEGPECIQPLAEQGQLFSL
jgi:hypothetical protein